MKLITFSHENRTRIGVHDGDSVVDLADAAPALPTEMCAFLAAGRAAGQRPVLVAADQFDQQVVDALIFSVGGAPGIDQRHGNVVQLNFVNVHCGCACWYFGPAAGP